VPLFSFLNPAHEAMIRDALSAAYPDMYLSISSEVQPEFREYERLSTTVLNAYLQPVIDRYLGDFAEGVAEAAPKAALGINQSSGGPDVGRARAPHADPHRTVGPRRPGAVGAIHMARLSGVPDCDLARHGGTSADVALMRNYTAGTTFNKWIEGYPARLASLDINAVGAGGGSIAWFDRDGLMKMGPQSAGAQPGPACYGRGGTEATVTDANLVLGPDCRRAACSRATWRSMNARAHRRSRRSPSGSASPIERTAHGMLGIVVANMVRAIRSVSVERGHDPRAFALLPFGGAGPLHATDVREEPRHHALPRAVRAGHPVRAGLIVSDLRETFVRTAVTPLSDARMADVRARIAN
jgi:N-methylhydantoinase A